VFESHKLNDRGIEQVNEFKTTMALAVQTILPLMSQSREMSLFMTHLETAVFYGTKAIAQKIENSTGVKSYP
jgi:hypothetical protein